MDPREDIRRGRRSSSARHVAPLRRVSGSGCGPDRDRLAALWVHPITNAIFVRDGGAFASTIAVLDVATQTTQSVPFAASLDLVRSRLRVTASGRAKYDPIGCDLSAAPSTDPPRIHDRDASRRLDVESTQVDGIEGDKLAAQQVSAVGTTPSAGGFVFDPVTRAVRDGENDWLSLRMRRIGADPPRVFDSFDAASICFLTGASLAIDSYADRSRVVKPALQFGDLAEILRGDWDDDTPVSTGGSVSIEFAGASAWVPVNHRVRRIDQKEHSIEGPWLSAEPVGSVASATRTVLAPGAHVLHAFAGDGQEATGFEPCHTALTVPIASVGVTISAPNACANGLDDETGRALRVPGRSAGCRDATAALESPRCDDDLDNDRDGRIDREGGARARPTRNASRTLGASGRQPLRARSARRSRPGSSRTS